MKQRHILTGFAAACVILISLNFIIHNQEKTQENTQLENVTIVEYIIERNVNVTYENESFERFYVVIQNQGKELNISNWKVLLWQGNNSSNNELISIILIGGNSTLDQSDCFLEKLTWRGEKLGRIELRNETNMTVQNVVIGGRSNKEINDFLNSTGDGCQSFVHADCRAGHWKGTTSLNKRMEGAQWSI